MSKITNSVGIGGQLAPMDSEDTFALCWQNYIKGGHHSVLYYDDMLLISLERRIVGMTCYVDEEKKTYQLIGGVKNSNWKPMQVTQTITPTFVITSKLNTGIQPLVIKMPSNGVITDIEAVCSTVGSTDCEIIIEKTNELGFETNAGWSTIFSDNKNLQILANKTTNKTAPGYMLIDGLVTKGDVLRLNVLQNGTSLKGLTIHISIQC